MGGVDEEDSEDQARKVKSVGSLVCEFVWRIRNCVKFLDATKMKMGGRKPRRSGLKGKK